MNAPRTAAIQGVMENTGLDAVAIVPGANFKKIFARDFQLMERPLLVIIPTGAKAVAIVPSLEISSFEKITLPSEKFDETFAKILPWHDQDGYQKAFQDAADSLPQLKKSQRFGLEAQRMRAFEQMALQEAFPDANFVDAHVAINSIRLKKTADEIKLLKKAIKISEDALKATILEIKVGQSEKEIKAILLKQIFSHNADGLAFNPIVAAGDNSAQPHAQARANYRIKPGDALLIDFGASWNGYNADITRTFFVAKVSKDDQEFYQTVLEANERGRKISKPGLTAAEVDDAVQLILENSKFAAYAKHKTGHGLGLDVHEEPHIMRGNNQILTAQMVYTIEPGLYREKCGVRIEDVIVLTENANECLTTFPRELQIVGCKL